MHFATDTGDGVLIRILDQDVKISYEVAASLCDDLEGILGDLEVSTRLPRPEPTSA